MWKSPHVRKGDVRWGERKIRDYWLIFLSPRRVSSFLTSGNFHTRSLFARSTIPEEKWGLLLILVVFGLSLLLFPSGDQVIAMLQLLFWSCLSIPVCPKSRNLGDINIYLNQLNEQEILSRKCILFVTYYSCNYINRNITLKILFTFIGAICY